MLSLASVGLFVWPGLNYGIDFVGGIVVEVETQGPADLARLRSGLETLDLGEVGLQEFGADNHVLVRVERQPGGEEAQMAAVTKVKAAIDAAAPAASFERVEVVGPKVSSELLSHRLPGCRLGQPGNAHSTSGSASNGNSRWVRSRHWCLM